MRKIKRGGVNLIRSSCENKRAKGEGEKSQIPGLLVHRPLFFMCFVAALFEHSQLCCMIVSLNR
jgi:hypothetical protein